MAGLFKGAVAWLWSLLTVPLVWIMEIIYDAGKWMWEQAWNMALWFYDGMWAWALQLIFGMINSVVAGLELPVPDPSGVLFIARSVDWIIPLSMIFTILPMWGGFIGACILARWSRSAMNWL